MDVVGEYLGQEQDSALCGYFQRYYAHFFPALSTPHRMTFVHYGSKGSIYASTPDAGCVKRMIAMCNPRYRHGGSIMPCWMCRTRLRVDDSVCEPTASA
jgi:hypothetical protein